MLNILIAVHRHAVISTAEYAESMPAITMWSLSSPLCRQSAESEKVFLYSYFVKHQSKLLHTQQVACRSVSVRASSLS